MNHIEQAYEQGLRVRMKYWGDKIWIKKRSKTHWIDESDNIGTSASLNLDETSEHWEIWHEDLPLLKDQTDIKAQIQTHLNQIQELLKQL